GNLQIAQFYSGAVQPSNVAAQAAGALFYGAAQNTGVMYSDPNVLANGNFQWIQVLQTEDGFTYFLPAPLMSASSGAVDQQGSGSMYSYLFPFEGASYLNFVQLDGTGRTFGLLQASGGIPGPTDPQWTPVGIADIEVNPVNSSDALISSSSGNIFATTNKGA